jgi:hypothetical protein
MNRLGPNAIGRVAIVLSSYYNIDTEKAVVNKEYEQVS